VGSRTGAIVRKEARESVWKLLLAGLLLIVVGASLGPMYGLLGSLLPPGVLEMLPEWLKGPLMQQIHSYNIYIWANWYGKNLYQMLTLFSVVFGAGLLAGEVSRGTAGFLFSKPVRRTQVLRTKYAVALGVLAASAVAGTLAAAIASSISGHPVDVLWFLSGLPAALAATALLLSITLVSSVVSRDTVKAAAMAFVVFMAISATAFVRPLRWLWVFGHMTAVRTLASGRIDWAAVAGMLLAALVFLLGAERILVRKDI